MKGIAEPPTDLRPARRRETWRGRLQRLKPLIPFAGGVVAALLALYVYAALNPPAQPLTVKQVNTAVAKAMASATPAPAFSAQAYRAIQPSLVLIQTTYSGSSGTASNGAGASGKEARGLGSGVLISDQGEILTALHVVEGASSIKVTFADGTQATAQVASSQPDSDIATLQPDSLPRQVIPAVMGNPGALRVGDEAYAVGNPFGLYGSLSAGVVSGLDRQFQATGSDREIDGLIQIDAAVNPGNSGGPLLNRDGQVVGIVVGILNPVEPNPTQEGFFVGIGFAVPITTAASGGPGQGPQY